MPQYKPYAIHSNLHLPTLSHTDLHPVAQDKNLGVTLDPSPSSHSKTTVQTTIISHQDYLSTVSLDSHLLNPLRDPKRGS